MPQLVTKTIRLREDQHVRLELEGRARGTSYNWKAGEIIRELLDIYWSSPNPGVDVYKLRGKLKSK